MKEIMKFSVLMISLAAFLPYVFAQPFEKLYPQQDSLDSKLRSFPIAQYLNKPIDTLIAHLPAGYDTNFVIGSNGNINRGASLQINYPPNNAYWIDVFITDAKYIMVNKQMDTPPKTAWPLSLLRKEKVGSVTIYTGAYEIINEGDIY